ARGLAHVGVLKVLQDLHVPVDMVVGTSMGAVVGGAFAAGHSLDGLEKLALHTPWPELLRDRPPREELAYRRRQEDLQLPSRIDFGLDSTGLRGPSSTLGSFALEQVLREVSNRVSQVSDTDRMPLPFRAVATDLANGEARVMHGPSLFDVMRASMSVPGAFTPIEVQGHLLADGGLVRNLPVDVARAMGADVIIAVNVGTPLLPRDQVVGALGVAQQMFNILTEQNVQASLRQLTPRDVLITPDLTGIGFLDFSRPALAIERGEQAARALAPQLQALAEPAAQYAQWNLRRTQPRFDDAAFQLSKLEIDGKLRADKAALAREFGLKPGDMVRPQDIETGITRLLGLGDYDRVEVHTVGSGAARELVVLPIESPLATNRLRLGLRLESDFRDTNTFSVLLQHTLPWVNRRGGEWRNFVQIGQLRRFETEFYQPLSNSSHWFVAPSLRYQASSRDLYSGRTRVARLGYSIASA
ncbi:MAG: patatin-like phospholipase family protein, partial [Betaproteobacteria bacterium]|nr:patatin-like phospholipase family protein [Betaproteobacteria bacterium]